MASVDALDPNRWNVGEQSGGSGRRNTVNLRSTIYAGLAEMDTRLFRKLDTSALPVDPERLALIRALVDAINSWKLAPITASGYARAFKKFVRWVDGSNGALSRTTIVPLIMKYRGDAPARIAVIKRAVAQMSDLTDGERELLFPAPVQSETAGEDWVITLDIDGSRRSADLLRFVIPGDTALPVLEFGELRKARQKNVVDDNSDRAEFVRALRDEFKALATARSLAPSTLIRIFEHSRGWVVWADDQGLALDKGTAIETLVSYSQHLTRQWRAGKLSDHTVHLQVSSIASILTGVLGRQRFEIVYRLSSPPRKGSGLTSARPATARLQEFCNNLSAIVGTLPSELLCATIHAPIQVQLWSSGEARPHDLPMPYGGLGDQVFDPRSANLPLTRLRIWAEMHRFLAFTGCNLSVVQNLTIGDWRANGLQMVALKGRANKYASVRASRRYEKHLAGHVEFLEAALPLPVKDDTPLFPGIRFSRKFRTKLDLVACLRARATAPRASIFNPSREPGVHDWVRAHGLTITSRQLRLAKATWLFRRHSGDSLRVSRAMGNTPGTAYDHYGGKGNLEQAIPEWSRHWASPRSQPALAPGKCESPGRYKPINDRGSAPGSCNEGGCLGCWHYRGEQSRDYIHRMLSYRYCLCFRAASNSEVAKLIDIIDQIVDAYLEENPDQRKAVHQLQSQISDQPHPRFAAMIRLLEIKYAT